MPTKLKKRRIIFIEDSLWFKIENLAQESKVSRSEALRRVLKNKLFINGYKTQTVISNGCLHKCLNIKPSKRDSIFYTYMFKKLGDDNDAKT